MTLQTQQPILDNSPAVLTDEQRRRVADALENAQSENTRRSYAGQCRKFRAWCEREEQGSAACSAGGSCCLCRGACRRWKEHVVNGGAIMSHEGGSTA